LASPDVASGVFPAISGFYGISESDSIGVCRTTLQVWLDQLSDCSEVLELDAQDEGSLEQTLNELEERVNRSSAGVEGPTLGFLVHHGCFWVEDPNQLGFFEH